MIKNIETPHADLGALIRRATKRDAEAACAVLRRSITECCAKDHGDESERLEAWLANKTPQNVREWIDSPGTYAFVAEAGGEVVGVAMMVESGEITLCYLVPEIRFLGVGKALLAELESKARDLGLEALRTYSTRTARAFYKRNGFQPAGTADSWHGTESYPMAKALGS